MKKNLFTALGTLILLTVFYAPSVSAFGFGANARYWIPAFSGDLRVNKGGIAGTQVDIKNDLGISNENFPCVDAFFGIGNHEINLTYSLINLTGAKNIQKSIIFNGDTYHVNAYVESDLKTNMIDFEYQYKFLNLGNILAGISIGIIGKVKYLDGEVRMRSTTGGSQNDNQEDFHIPLPMIGLGADVGLLADILDARVKFAGMTYDGSFFYDAMAEISLTPLPFFNIHGGYRAMSLKIDNVSDIYAKLDFNGPYAGLAIGF